MVNTRLLYMLVLLLRDAINRVSTIERFLPVKLSLLTIHY